ncbi:MAG: hypothetical protein ABSH20_19420, partial [Tepidisphaeraceae bacterium]
MAAAVAVNVETETNTASIGSGAFIVANAGSVSVLATDQTNATAKATGTALDPNAKANVAGAVGLNYANVTNQALVGSGSHVTGQGITVAANQPPQQNNDFIVWGIAAAGGASSDAGVAGSVGVEILTFNTQASVGQNAVLISNGGGISVNSGNSIGLQNLAVSGGFGTKVGLGASVVVNVINTTTDAFIDQNASADASDAISVTANDSITPMTVNIPMINDGPTVTSVAVAGGVSSGNAGIGGSAIVDVMDLTTDAYIASGAQINQTLAGNADQSVTVSANDSTTITSGAGGLGGSLGGAGLGIGIVVDVLTKDTEAYIAPTANVKARQDVSVNSVATEDIKSIAASVGAGDSAGIAGSIVVLVMGNPQGGGTKASLGGTLNAGGNVSATASDTPNLNLLAGGLAFGGTAGVGLSAVVLVKTNTVNADVAAQANITAAGLTVSATQPDTVQVVAVAGAGGGTAGVAGSGSVEVINETTDAWIDQNAIVHTSGSVMVTATNNTNILGVAGALAIGGEAGVGAGVDVEVITKDTQAWIGGSASVTAGLNVIVNARSSETQTSISAGGAGGGTAAIAINAGVPILDITTEAHVDSGATVTATGSADIAADEQTNINVISGNVTVSGTASVGAAAAVPVVTKTTESYVAAGAQVVALGKDGSGITINNGTLGAVTTPTVFSPAAAVSGNNINLGYTDGLTTGQQVVYYTDGGNAIGGLTDGTVYYAIIVDPTTIELAATQSDANAGTAIALDKSAATGSLQRIVPTNQVAVQDSTSGGSDTSANTAITTVTPNTTTGFEGLAVTATNRDKLAVAGVSGGGSGAVAVNIGGAVDVSNITTEAHIDSGAAINNSGAAGGAAQSVLVGAANDYRQLGIAGAISVSGAVSVAPGADVRVIHLNTNAFIADGAIVNAVKDVSVAANTAGNYLSVAAGAAGSGTVAVGGAVSVSVLYDLTQAYIGNTAGTLAGGAKVTAGGNVVVSANDSTTVKSIAGSLGLGIGAVGVGASVALVDINKTTNAYIGSDVTVNAGGQGTVPVNVYKDANTGAGTYTLVPQTGLVVQAVSSENVNEFAVSGAGGVFAGVAGGVTVELIASNTTADIGSGAQIDQNGGGSPAQGVDVAAVNTDSINSSAGGIGGGIAGIGGAIDVGMVRNNTVAYIGPSAVVSANGDVDVNAFSVKNVTSLALSAAGGIVAGAGSVSVWAIGTQLASNYSDQGGNSSDALSTNGGSAQSFADTQTGGSAGSNGYSSILSGFSGNGNANSSSSRIAAQTSSADGTIGSNAPNGVVSAAASSTTPVLGTNAYIDHNATVNSGGSVGVRAKDAVTFNMTVGNVSGGAVALGGSIAVASINDNTDAHIGSGATVNAGGNVLVNAALGENSSGNAYAGQGGLASLGAQAVVINDNSTQAAHIDSGATINRAGGSLIVHADSTRTVTSDALGVSFGGIAAGAAVAIATVGGWTTATTAGINVGLGGTVGGIDIAANSNDTAHAEVLGVNAGIDLAATGAVSIATVNPTVTASLGNGSNVSVTGNIGVVANSQAVTYAKSTGIAVSGGLSIGISMAQSQMTPTLSAFIGTGNFTAGGNVTVASLENSTPTATPIGNQAYAYANASGGGILAGNGAVANANSNAPVLTHIAGNVTANNGTVAVQSFVNNQANADGEGITVGVVGVGEVFANATAGQTGPSAGATTGGGTSGTVSSSIDGGASIHSASLNVQTQAAEDATAAGQAPGGGVVVVLGSSATAGVGGINTSSIAGGATIVTSGNTSVSAGSDRNGSSSAQGVTIGVVAVGTNQATTNVGGSTIANVADNTTSSGTADMSVGGLSVTATGTDTGSATVSASGGGVFNVQSPTDNQANTTINPTTQADIGNSHYVNSTG